MGPFGTIGASRMSPQAMAALHRVRALAGLGEGGGEYATNTGGWSQSGWMPDEVRAAQALAAKPKYAAVGPFLQPVGPGEDWDTWKRRGLNYASYLASGAWLGTPAPGAIFPYPVGSTWNGATVYVTGNQKDDAEAITRAATFGGNARAAAESGWTPDLGMLQRALDVTYPNRVPPPTPPLDAWDIAARVGTGVTMAVAASVAAYGAYAAYAAASAASAGAGAAGGAGAEMVTTGAVATAGEGAAWTAPTLVAGAVPGTEMVTITAAEAAAVAAGGGGLLSSAGGALATAGGAIASAVPAVVKYGVPILSAVLGGPKPPTGASGAPAATQPTAGSGLTPEQEAAAKANAQKLLTYGGLAAVGLLAFILVRRRQG